MENEAEQQDETNSEMKATEETEEEQSDSHASIEPRQGGTLTYGMIAEPKMFNELYSDDSASSDVEINLFDGLVQVGPNMEVEPLLAKKWDISDDGLVYTFTLKEGVKFHDGEELTAEDVAFTFGIFKDDDYTGPRAGSFEYLADVRAVDEYTVEFRLSEPDARFLTLAGYGILPEHILGDVPVEDLGNHPFNTKEPVGTGPFRFVEWQAGQYIKLEAFEDYHQGRPYLDHLIYKFVPDQNALMSQLEAGDVDMMVIPATEIDMAQQWDEDGKIKLHAALGQQYNYMGFNLRLDLFKDKETRQAITHALDREAIIEHVVMGQGEIAHGPVSPLSWAYTDKLPRFEYDPDKAKALLAEAGWEEGEDGILERNGQRFSFALSTNQGNKVREELTVVIQDQLAEVGIEVQPNLMEWNAFIESITPPQNDFEAFISGWSLGADPDPRDIWHSDEIEQGLNSVGYSNPKVDQLIDKNIHLIDQEERKKVLEDIFVTIADEQPYTFLYYPYELTATPRHMRGFAQHPQLRFYKAHEWWLDE